MPTSAFYTRNKVRPWTVVFSNSLLRNLLAVSSQGCILALEHPRCDTWTFLLISLLNLRTMGDLGCDCYICSFFFFFLKLLLSPPAIFPQDLGADGHCGWQRHKNTGGPPAIATRWQNRRFVHRSDIVEPPLKQRALLSPATVLSRLYKYYFLNKLLWHIYILRVENLHFKSL